MSKSTNKKKLNWKQKIVRELTQVEDLLPEPEFMQGDWPEWTRQMAAEIMKTAVPGVKFSKFDDPTAHEVGRFVGVKRASMREIEECELSEKQEVAIDRLLKQQRGEQSEEKLIEHMHFIEKTYWPACERAVNWAIALAAKQTPQEQAEFFNGYSHMVVERPDARADTTTRIYLVMVIYWRLFETLRKSGNYSVRQLHELLCKAFGSHLVGDLKKTEKMCERKGLSFRKPGRPSLPVKSDTQPA